MGLVKTVGASAALYGVLSMLARTLLGREQQPGRKAGARLYAMIEAGYAGLRVVYAIKWLTY